MGIETVAGSPSTGTYNDNVTSLASGDGFTIDTTEEQSEFRDKVKATNAKKVATIPSGKEKIHLAFLKVHKAASSTIQNIVFRFKFFIDI